MSYYIALPLILFLALVEAAVLPLFRIAGLQPNLVLVLLTVWLIVRGQNEAFMLIPVGGFCLGLVDGAPLGTALVALAPLALLQELRGSQLGEGGFVQAICFVLVMTVAFHVVYLLVFTLGHHPQGWLTAMTQVVLPTALLNAIVLIPTYWVVSIASQDLRRPAYA